MFKPFERLLAFRYLRSRKEDGFISVVSWFSLIGIALGVGTLIVVMSVMNGFRHELVTRILGVDGHVMVLGNTNGLQGFDAMTEALRAMPEVTAAIPYVEGQVMAMSQQQATGVQLRGYRLQDLTAHKTVLAHSVAQGSLEQGWESTDEAANDDGIALGYRIAQKLNVRVGDEITLVSPRTRATVMGAVPIMKSYRIAALLDLGMYEYDSTLVLLPLGAAQRYLGLQPDAVSAIEITGTSPMQAPYLAGLVRDHIPAYYRIFPWQRMHAQFVNALEVERNVMFLILSLIIMVAAFNIISSLIMLVKDKEAEIAILRTMGASRGAILRIFFLAGASIGIIGTVLGVTLGLSFALNIESIRAWLEGLTGTELFAAEIYFLSTLPAIVEWKQITQVVAMAFGLTFLATLYPAWRASRTEPAEALRYV